MPRNGTGNYALPNDALVNGEASDVSDYNGTMNDLASEITNSVAVDGQSTMTGNLKMGTNKITGVDDPTSAQDAATKTYVDTATATRDLNGNELVLDADADTSITADTDDQIDFKIGGTDELSLTAAKADNLDDIAALSHTDGNLIVSDGTDWTSVTPASQNICRIATGSYTGDGAVSQAITGVGFQPKFVKIWQRRTSDGSNVQIMETTDTINDDNAAGMAIQHLGAGGHQSQTNTIISLDSDGFTVDDAGADNPPNANGIVYNYLCLG